MATGVDITACGKRSQIRSSVKLACGTDEKRSPNGRPELYSRRSSTVRAESSYVCRPTSRTILSHIDEIAAVRHLLVHTPQLVGCRKRHE